MAAAGVVVEDERGFAALPAFQPRLHGWPGSYEWRRRVAPKLLARFATS